MARPAWAANAVGNRQNSILHIRGIEHLNLITRQDTVGAAAPRQQRAHGDGGQDDEQGLAIWQIYWAILTLSPFTPTPVPQRGRMESILARLPGKG